MGSCQVGPPEEKTKMSVVSGSICIGEGHVGAACFAAESKVGRPILQSIGSMEPGCSNVLCCGMLPQVYGCLASAPSCAFS